MTNLPSEHWVHRRLTITGKLMTACGRDILAEMRFTEFSQLVTCPACLQVIGQREEAIVDEQDRQWHLDHPK